MNANLTNFLNKSFSAKSSVIRAAKPLIADRIITEADITVEEVEGRFVAKLVPVIGEFTFCPCCGIHLENGVGTHGQEVNGRIIKHDAFEYECLACGEEFGPAVAKAAPKAEASEGRIPFGRLSTCEKPTKAVWNIADEMKAANPAITRKEVVAECIRRGVAPGTARTQFQAWFKANNA